MNLTEEEVTSISCVWFVHKRRCKNRGAATLEQLPGGGIGTVTNLVCGCGEKFDVTDYDSW